MGDNYGHVGSLYIAGAKKLLNISLFGFDRSEGKWQLQPKLVEYNLEVKSGKTGVGKEAYVHELWRALLRYEKKPSDLSEVRR